MVPRAVVLAMKTCKPLSRWNFSLHHLRWHLFVIVEVGRIYGGVNTSFLSIVLFDRSIRAARPAVEIGLMPLVAC
jgi:hypothetical protein